MTFKLATILYCCTKLLVQLTLGDFVKCPNCPKNRHRLQKQEFEFVLTLTSRVPLSVTNSLIFSSS